MNYLHILSVAPASTTGKQPLVLLNEPVGEDSPELGFWDFWRVIRKRRRLIAIFFLTLVSTVAVGTLLMTPIYTSQATLLIQEKTPQLVDFRQVVSEAIGTEKHDYFATQAEILKSPSLAAQVIQEQRLGSNKIFTGEEKTGIVAKPWSILKDWVVTETPVKAILSWVKGIFSSGKTEVSDPTVTLRATNRHLPKGRSGDQASREHAPD